MAIVTAAYLSVVILAAVVRLRSPLAPYLDDTTTSAAVLADLLVSALWLVVLLVSLARQPAGRLWQLIFLYAVVGHLGSLMYVPDSLAWSLGRVIGVAGIAIFVHLLLAYPTGRLQDAFDRGVVALAYGLALAWVLTRIIAAPAVEVACVPGCVRNVFALWPDVALHDRILAGITFVTAAMLFPLLLVGLWRHWRHATPVARRSLLPLVATVPPLLIAAAIDLIGTEAGVENVVSFFDSAPGEAIALLGPMLVPAAILVGLLRTRWDRGRLADLVARLADGVPAGRLRDVLAATLGDPTLQLAFPGPSGAGFIDAEGHPVQVPDAGPTRGVTRLERDGALVATLIHDPALDDEDPGLVEAAGHAARLAIENERLAAEVKAHLAEVRASRARIVDATDAARREIERDLHDGAQQRLVALAMRLQLAKAATPGASRLLDDATTELEIALAEIRGLALGVHPPILTEAGLGAAVDALAERAPLPVDVDVDIATARAPASIEVAAYFVVAEALTNVARHAHASSATVTIRGDDAALSVTVSDDGRGGAKPTSGTGLSGLADRVAAAGGSLSIADAPGGGTLVRAELPMTQPAGSPPAVTQPAVPSPDPASMPPASPPDAIDFAPAHGPGTVPSRASERDLASGSVRNAHPVRWVLGGLLVLLVLAGAGGVVSLIDRTPLDGRAERFARPFVFQVPAGSGIRLREGPLDPSAPRSDRLHVLAASMLDGAGVSIWLVDSFLTDACDRDGGSEPIPVGVDAFLARLREETRLVVLDSIERTVDGRPATQVDVKVAPGNAGCPSGALALWRDQTAPTTGAWMQVPDDATVRLIALDVDGATVVIEIWRHAGLARWQPTADSIVDSIRFLRPGADAGVPW